MMMEKCGAKEGASEAEIESIWAKKSPTTMPGKCIQACLAETAGMVTHQYYVACYTMNSKQIY